MPLSVQLKASIIADLTRSIDLANAASNLSKILSQVFSDGAGAAQANVLWSDRRTLGASAAESLDFAGGSLTDIYGQAVTLARIKALIITSDAANLNDIQVTRPGANGIPIYLAAGDGEPLHPGGVILKCWPGATGVVVTAATGDLITITNAAGVNSVTYDIVVVGASS